MRTSIPLILAVLCITAALATGCSSGETSDHVDGMHGSKRAAPATDLSDTANYRLRNEHADKQRGDTLPKAVRDTAFH